MLKKNNEALLQYVDDIKALRSIVLNEIGQAELPSLAMPPQNNSSTPTSNRENILKKALKCKQLEDDNKKLRKLLKTQIENSEQLRQDTQNTIETLREEFDILVKELLQYKSKDDKNAKMGQPMMAKPKPLGNKPLPTFNIASVTQKPQPEALL